MGRCSGYWVVVEEGLAAPKPASPHLTVSAITQPFPGRSQVALGLTLTLGGLGSLICEWG